MDKVRITRELAIAERLASFGARTSSRRRVGYKQHPSAKRRPITESDVDDVMVDVEGSLNTAYSILHSSKAEVSKATDLVEGSRVNLNFVQIGIQHPGSTVDPGRARRIANATKHLKEAQEQLEDVYKAIAYAENEIARASGEIK